MISLLKPDLDVDFATVLLCELQICRLLPHFECFLDHLIYFLFGQIFRIF